MGSRKPIDTADDVGNHVEMTNKGRFVCETDVDEHEPFAHEEHERLLPEIRVRNRRKAPRRSLSMHSERTEAPSVRSHT